MNHCYAYDCVPVVPARGGAEVALGIYISPFSSIEFACAVRQPGPCVRALYEAVAQMLSKNMTCARPRRNATPSEHFPHTSQCTLHTLHFALHTRTSHSTFRLTSNHVSSSHLISALLISSHLFSHVIKVSSSQLFSSHPSTDQPFSSPRSSSQLILAVLHARKVLMSERSLLQKKTIGRRKFLHTDA